jgi:hypothetical protein
MTRSTAPPTFTLAYDKGASIHIFTQGCGRSYGFVHRLLTEAGTTLRSRGGPNRRAGHRAGQFGADGRVMYDGTPAPGPTGSLQIA